MRSNQLELHFYPFSCKIQKDFLPLPLKLLFETMYKNIEEPIMTTQDTETMDLENARELLHQMVKEVYPRP